MMTDKPFKQVIKKIPTELHEYKKAIELGLFFLAIGKRPCNLENDKGRGKTIRINLTKKAVEHLHDIMNYKNMHPDIDTETKALRWALMIIQEQPHINNICK